MTSSHVANSESIVTNRNVNASWQNIYSNMCNKVNTKIVRTSKYYRYNNRNCVIGHVCLFKLNSYSFWLCIGFGDKTLKWTSITELPLHCDTNKLICYLFDHSTEQKLQLLYHTYCGRASTI